MSDNNFSDSESSGEDSDEDGGTGHQASEVFEVLFQKGTLGLSICQRRSDSSFRVNSASGASASAGVEVGDTLLSVGGTRLDSGVLRTML